MHTAECRLQPTTRLRTARTSYEYACPTCGTAHRYAFPGWREQVTCADRENGDFDVRPRERWTLVMLWNLALHVALNVRYVYADARVWLAGWIYRQHFEQWPYHAKKYRARAKYAWYMREDFWTLGDMARIVWDGHLPQREWSARFGPVPLALYRGWMEQPALNVYRVDARGVGTVRFEAWRQRASGEAARRVVAAQSWTMSVLGRRATITAALVLMLLMPHVAKAQDGMFVIGAIVGAAATGNLTTAGTWGAIDATSYLNSETASTNITTSFVESTAFTPGAITIDGIALKLDVRSTTTGTVSVHLAIAGVEVVGTLVSMNVADLSASTTGTAMGGWIFFKFAAPVLLVAATNYTFGIKVSSASSISAYRDGTSGNWSRYLRTTTTGAPGAGDDMIIVGENTGAGTRNALTVTMDETAATDYGAASTSLVTPALAIGQGGTLTWGTTTATPYNLKLSGHLIVYANGTYNQGTTGTKIPRDSSATLLMDCAANVDFGVTARNLSTFVTQGQSRTSGKDIVVCKLNTDEAANSTSLGVDTSPDWLDNDEIAIATTTRTQSECENGTLNGNSSGGVLTVDGFGGAGGGIANAHSGTSPVAAEVILLTRNVRIIGTSTSVQTYIDIKATATVDCDWTEFKFMGSATANKRGIDVATTSGSFSFSYCAWHRFEVASSIGVNMSATSGAGTLEILNCVSYRCTGTHLFTADATTTNFTTVTNYVSMMSLVANALNVSLRPADVVSGVTCVGSFANGISITSNSQAPRNTTTISNVVSHGNGNVALTLGRIFGRTVDNVQLYRNLGPGLQFSTLALDITVSNGDIWGNAVTNIDTGATPNLVRLVKLNVGGDTTFSSPIGIRIGTDSNIDADIYSCNFGVASGLQTTHTTADISVVGVSKSYIRMRACTLASATEVSGQSNLNDESYISSQKHDNTAGLHKTWKGGGTLAIDTGTVHTGSQSMSMTPNSATRKLETKTDTGFLVAVANGATVTPTVFIQKSAAYNGNQPRLIVKRNDAVGITQDTVLATYSAGTGSWNSISGATAAATDDGVMEFVIDCDGTAGVVYVDSLSVA